MKYRLLITSIILGLSFSVQANFFDIQKMGVQIEMNKALIKKGIINKPLFVFADGKYHLISKDTYPFYSNNAFDNNFAVRQILYPKEVGSLWMSTFAKNNTLLLDTNSMYQPSKFKYSESARTIFQQNISLDQMSYLRMNMNFKYGGLLKK
ncbi:MAG TPA: hypothetical protein VLZ83_09570 [Edaphocola sp.]|nr:hypothetical protein [Edaphocola sp.]